MKCITTPITLSLSRFDPYPSNDIEILDLALRTSSITSSSKYLNISWIQFDIIDEEEGIASTACILAI